MAQANDKEFKKDQDIEIYDSSKDRWIKGKIYDIKTSDNGRSKVFCVEYEEYAKEIDVKDAHSVMRIPKSKQQPNDRSLTDAFINFRREIPTQSPVSHETQIVLNTTRNSTAQRMIYLYIQSDYTVSWLSLFKMLPKQSK